jgi:Domain of unknown function (DUF4373)
MAKKDNSYWFTHDCDASSDPKIVALIKKYDMAGYGRWWCILEVLRKSEGYKYDISSKFGYSSLAHIIQLSVEQCRAFIDDCINEFDLLISDDSFIWSNGLLTRMEIWDKKREVLSERGRRGAEVRHGKKAPETPPTEELPLLKDNIEPSDDAKTLATLKTEYKALPKEKSNVYNFIKTRRPTFIDPYVDMWNIWAADYKKAKVSMITPKRRTHLNARLREKQFDFLAILTRATKSAKCLEEKWFDFDFITKSQDNYLKVLEGKYDNSAMQVPASQSTASNAADDKLERMINRPAHVQQ